MNPLPPGYDAGDARAIPLRPDGHSPCGNKEVAPLFATGILRALLIDPQPHRLPIVEIAWGFLPSSPSHLLRQKNVPCRIRKIPPLSAPFSSSAALARQGQNAKRQGPNSQTARPPLPPKVKPGCFFFFWPVLPQPRVRESLLVTGPPG